MKWLVGIFLLLNFGVFLLAKLSPQQSTASSIGEVPDSAQAIKLLSSSAMRARGNCVNLGPIEQQIVLNRFQQLLDQYAYSYKIIPEESKKILAHRVLIRNVDENSLEDLKQRLKSVGVDEVYEKTTDSGDRILSLGVFTYKKTALDFAANLSNAGFAAESVSELLQFNERYWLNVDRSLDQSIAVELRNYIGADKFKQNAAPCL